MTVNCSSCGNAFGCSISQDCWCFKYPRIEQTLEAKTCLCPDCLLQITARQINEGNIEIPSEQLSAIADLGISKKPLKNIDYYINEDSNFVFTKWYHLRRGYCCENLCKHCPYKH